MLCPPVYIPQPWLMPLPLPWEYALSLVHLIFLLFLCPSPWCSVPFNWRIPLLFHGNPRNSIRLRIRYVQRRVGPCAPPNGSGTPRAVTIERHPRDVFAHAVQSATMLPMLMLFVQSLLVNEVASQGMSQGRSAATSSVKGLTLLS